MPSDELLADQSLGNCIMISFVWRLILMAK